MEASTSRRGSHRAGKAGRETRPALGPVGGIARPGTQVRGSATCMAAGTGDGTTTDWASGTDWTDGLAGRRYSAASSYSRPEVQHQPGWGGAQDAPPPRNIIRDELLVSEVGERTSPSVTCAITQVLHRCLRAWMAATPCSRWPLGGFSLAPRAPAGLLWARRGKGGRRRWCRSVAGESASGLAGLSPSSCFSQTRSLRFESDLAFSITKNAKCLPKVSSAPAPGRRQKRTWRQRNRCLPTIT